MKMLLANCKFLKLRKLQQFDFIENCENYEAAIRAVNDLYVKTTIAIFARDLLATAKKTRSEARRVFAEFTIS